MTLLAWVVALTLNGSADDLMAIRVGNLKIGVPAAWKRTVEQGTQRFDAPSQDASFTLDVFPLDSPLAPILCRDKLVQALGGKGWQKLSLGAAPAARKVFLDADPEKKTEVQTFTYVGCDGRTKWALTFTAADAKKRRFEPLAEKIAQSVSFVKEAP
ncbi:MAG: hypothetical protein ACT4TC_16490 [Myxococcaceae bacterium]